MSLKIGIHTGPQNLSMDDLRRLWQKADDGGLHWVSVWDHFYANPLRERSDPCFEGVASMAALAATTKNVRVGCLVFCALFRTPSLLAKAAITIDHISGGRADIGVGAGWFEEEFKEFGYDFPPLGKRLDQAEEAMQVLRSLWSDDVTSFHGDYYDLEGAVCAPKPIGLRLWVGGSGPKRTPRMAARYADGFNMPYRSPDDIAQRLETVARECEAIGRDPAEIDTSANLGFYMGASEGRPSVSGAPPEAMSGGSLTGGPQQAIDRLGEYERAGIQGVNIAFRPPVDWDAYDAFLTEVAPVFQG